MSSHCDYSFSDLYSAAFGTAPDRVVLEELYALSQDERNVVVRDWAARAGWETVSVVGTDGVTYASFGPEGSSPCA
ncbi:MAG: hypothetical protein H6505_03310 [Calditrichaeota bacterium]|nr:hypothetical protein [Calditrichota bacterium]